MIPIEEMTQGELAAYVFTHLQKNGINVVLSGGAAVSIYSRSQYISHDIDFIPAFTVKRRAIKDAM